MSLLFQPEHVEQIRSGEKTATRRDWSENYNPPRAGTVQMATESLFESDEECECYIRIKDIYEQPLGEMTARDAEREGGYTLEEFRKKWEEINDEWDPDKVVTAVEFEYVGRSRPTKQVSQVE
ncbi:ASCH domain-containing protein [Halobacteria archaeon AArc-curdl1]|uniref:ASCH domain-containing protein n=1 Tax=Natronosalvus hydrolyticus TaxID=2979988 RepID=A0AAP3E5H2_9EURY|nr:ASCH domain-containing protein [Halobacteria archaeon AArc-curdl1]